MQNTGSTPVVSNQGLSTTEAKIGIVEDHIQPPSPHHCTQKHTVKFGSLWGSAQRDVGHAGCGQSVCCVLHWSMGEASPECVFPHRLPEMVENRPPTADISVLAVNDPFSSLSAGLQESACSVGHWKYQRWVFFLRRCSPHLQVSRTMGWRPLLQK